MANGSEMSRPEAMKIQSLFRGALARKDVRAFREELREDTAERLQEGPVSSSPRKTSSSMK